MEKQKTRFKKTRRSISSDAKKYEEAIKAWHKKANKHDRFTSFMLEYLAFICFINSKLYPGYETDRIKIQRLKRNLTVKNHYLNLVQRENKINYAWKLIKTELDTTRLGNVSRDSATVQEIEWWNCSKEDINQKTQQEKTKIKGVIHSLTDWENMVEFWYSIRNNLFHGMKNPEFRRDKLLVFNGFKTLRPLVQIFINNINRLEELR